MILTLRTLLAWLDDTAPLADSQQIGRLVEGNPAVLELVGRIYEVMHCDGAEATLDDDRVSNYLDNQLEPADVVAFEEVCLGSDAVLAQVCDTHRILSFIGKRVHVPDGSKPRMYKLGPGREPDPEDSR